MSLLLTKYGRTVLRHPGTCLPAALKLCNGVAKAFYKSGPP
jgi:hypothetical protein